MNTEQFLHLSVYLLKNKKLLKKEILQLSDQKEFWKDNTRKPFYFLEDNYF